MVNELGLEAEIRLPVIVWDDGDLLVFRSLANLESYLEIEDLHDYEAFDAAGTSVLLSRSFTEKRFLWFFSAKIPVVRAVLKRPVEHRSEELAERIRSFLAATGVDMTEILDHSLDRLIEMLLEVVRD